MPSDETRVWLPLAPNTSPVSRPTTKNAMYKRARSLSMAASRRHSASALAGSIAGEEVTLVHWRPFRIPLLGNSAFLVKRDCGRGREMGSSGGELRASSRWRRARGADVSFGAASNGSSSAGQNHFSKTADARTPVFVNPYWPTYTRSGKKGCACSGGLLRQDSASSV